MGLLASAEPLNFNRASWSWVWVGWLVFILFYLVLSLLCNFLSWDSLLALL
jgi:hypothetical protein